MIIYECIIIKKNFHVQNWVLDDTKKIFYSVHLISNYMRDAITNMNE